MPPVDSVYCNNVGDSSALRKRGANDFIENVNDSRDTIDYINPVDDKAQAVLDTWRQQYKYVFSHLAPSNL